MHAWNDENFRMIASVFGRTFEVEDWTTDKDQTHIGRVLILTNLENTICETVCLKVDGHDFFVKILEDIEEIVDFGPRYDLDEASSEQSLDDSSACGEALHGESPDGSEVEETPPSALGKTKGRSQLSIRQLEIVNSLNETKPAEVEELEEGELRLENIEQPPAFENDGPTRDTSGLRSPSGGLAFEAPLPSCDGPLVHSGKSNGDDTFYENEFQRPSPGVAIPCPLKILPSSKPPSPDLLKSALPFPPPRKFSSSNRSGGFVGKLSLREAKRMTRLKIARTRSSSASLSFKGFGIHADSSSKSHVRI